MPRGHWLSGPFSQILEVMQVSKLYKCPQTHLLLFLSTQLHTGTLLLPFVKDRYVAEANVKPDIQETGLIQCIVSWLFFAVPDQVLCSPDVSRYLRGDSLRRVMTSADMLWARYWQFGCLQPVCFQQRCHQLACHQ